VFCTEKEKLADSKVVAGKVEPYWTKMSRKQAIDRVAELRRQSKEIFTSDKEISKLKQGIGLSNEMLGDLTFEYIIEHPELYNAGGSKAEEVVRKIRPTIEQVLRTMQKIKASGINNPSQILRTSQRIEQDLYRIMHNVQEAKDSGNKAKYEKARQRAIREIGDIYRRYGIKPAILGINVIALIVDFDLIESISKEFKDINTRAKEINKKLERLNKEKGLSPKDKQLQQRLERKLAELHRQAAEAFGRIAEEYENIKPHQKLLTSLQQIEIKALIAQLKLKQYIEIITAKYIESAKNYTLDEYYRDLSKASAKFAKYLENLTIRAEQQDLGSEELRGASLEDGQRNLVKEIVNYTKSQRLKEIFEPVVNHYLYKYLASLFGYKFYTPSKHMGGNDYFEKLIKLIKKKYGNVLVVEGHLNSVPGLLFFFKEGGITYVAKVKDKKVKVIEYSGNPSRILKYGQHL
jgi:hypothetical protein